jgi:predicted ABC-type ATPase
VTELNEPISREEIIVAVERVKLRKAAGFDEIPADVLGQYRKPFAYRQSKQKSRVLIFYGR